MPSNKVHCEISEKRTKGNSYQELHKWMDEASGYIGQDHRLERHFYTEEYRKYIAEKWGDKAVVEWLFHIAIDNLETANKFAIEAYKQSFEEIGIKFNGKMISQCKFIKMTSTGKPSEIKISVNEEEILNVQNKISDEKKVVTNEKSKKKPYNFYRRYKKK